jgi:hypothetical protein
MYGHAVGDKMYSSAASPTVGIGPIQSGHANVTAAFKKEKKEEKK